MLVDLGLMEQWYKVVLEVLGGHHPAADEVGLDLGDLLQGGGEVGPILLLLALVGLMPENVGRDAPHPQRAQVDRLAGQIDLAELRLADAVVVAELGEFAAGAALLLFDVAGGGMAQQEQRDQQDGDGRQVDDLADESCLRSHLATSRVFRKRYPATNTGRRKPNARKTDCHSRSSPPARLQGMLNP